ncbi:ABC transporter permease [Streptomyces sp. TRM S81-3]|uniref:ABC transporter permease n=1 Tax=Streptomyces griseicoloratus TaxID=2752516 RepID=A0A926LEG1_9ACTN|nr:ABC transporter permease [Streptomyces griseicoloratus]MBD0425037.1 ABC transporter permease [Streptomyces griseicoloratus]
MSAVLEVPAEAGSPSRGGARAAVLALARFEARRLLLSVPVAVAFVGYVVWIVWHGRNTWDGYPALQDADRATQNMPMLVGLAVLLSANLAVLRSWRHGTESRFAALVVSPWSRTAAHALSVVPAALLTAVCVAGQFTREALKPGAVGHGSPAELLVGPLTVLLFGVLGVLVARLVRSAWAAPLAVVCLLFLFVLGTGPSGTDGVSWLAPVVTEPSTKTLPSALLGRPAAWHALYLAGAALTLAFLAVLAAGGRSRTVKAGVALSLALALTGGIAQAARMSPSPELTAARERASVSPEKEQTCVERGGSRYCAFPEWTARTGAWAGVVDEVRSLAGGSAHGQRLVVRQRLDARYGLEGDAALAPSEAAHQVTVGTSWGGNRVPEFSTAVAAVLVAGSEKASGGMCDGRMVTVMWLSLSWQDDPLGALRRVRLDDSLSGSAVVLSPTDPLTMTEGQTDVVRRLLGEPRAAVAQRVKAHWAELTSPGVTTARAAELLGVKGPEKADSCEE